MRSASVLFASGVALSRKGSSVSAILSLGFLGQQFIDEAAERVPQVHKECGHKDLLLDSRSVEGATRHSRVFPCLSSEELLEHHRYRKSGEGT